MVALSHHDCDSVFTLWQVRSLVVVMVVDTVTTVVVVVAEQKLHVVSQYPLFSQ